MGDSISKEDSIKKGWKVVGDTDLWVLLCKAVNLDTGEYHSTKVLHLETGCLIQCDSQDQNGNLVRTTTYAPEECELLLRRSVNSCREPSA